MVAAPRLSRRATEETHSMMPRLCSLAAALVLVLGAVPVSAADDARATFDLQERLTQLFESQPGGAVALTVVDGVTTTATTGEADASGRPMTADTPLWIGSLTKTYIATMVLQLVEEGLVDLDAPLSTYLPETLVGGDVPIADLLAQRSGIGDFPPPFDAILADPARTWTSEDLFALVDGTEPGTEPGVHSYANINYALLGRLIEAIDGDDLQSSLEARLTGPLGLEVTAFAFGDTPRPPGLAAGWLSDFGYRGQSDAEIEAMASSAYAQGGLVSTAPEVATFFEALFAGDLISEASLAQMLDTGDSGYGFGVMTDEYALGDLGSETRYLGHGGIHPLGHRSFAAGDPESGNLFVVLTNAIDSSPEEIAKAIVGSWAAAGG
jgi:D-alanyl-D-alanine carboxypeptidase